MPAKATFLDQVTQDFWKHVGGLVAVGIGFAGWYSGGLNHDPTAVQFGLIIAGLATQGVLVYNGASKVAASATAQAIYDAANLAAQKVISDAATQAVSVREVAVTTAEKLPMVPVASPKV